RLVLFRSVLRQLVLLRPRSGREGVRAAATLRLDEQGAAVPVQPGEGKGSAQLIELPRAVQGRLLVSDGRLASVHARSEAELRGVRSEPREFRLQRHGAQRTVAARLRQARQ